MFGMGTLGSFGSLKGLRSSEKQDAMLQCKFAALVCIWKKHRPIT